MGRDTELEGISVPEVIGNLGIMKRRSKMVRTRLAALGAVLASLGCSGRTVDSFCNDPNLLWLWLILPVLFGAAAGFVIYLSRMRQLKRWNLSCSPTAPPTQSLWGGALAIALVLIVSFLFFMIPAEACEPDQKSDNITFWLLGNLLGTMVALGGLLLAKQHYSKGSERW